MLRIFLASFVIIAAATCSAHALVNGDFSDGLNGWTTLLGPVSEGPGGVALMEENPIWEELGVTVLEQQIVLPAGAVSLSFEYLLTSEPDGTTPTWLFLSDAFAVVLDDPVTHDPIVGTSVWPWYFSVDFWEEDHDLNVDYDPSIVTVTGDVVTVDLTGVTAPRDAVLSFWLFDTEPDYDGYTTTVTVDNVVLHVNQAVIPEPLTLLGVPLGLLGIARYVRRRGLPLV